MTRKDDDKMGNPEFSESTKDEATYNAKVEARWTKEAKAKSGQDGEPDARRMGKSHADDGGEHRL